MGQVGKKLTFGRYPSSDAKPLQRKDPSTMIQTSILRYIISDHEHFVAQNPKSILLRLPYEIRCRIYEYAGLTNGNAICLNYEYPDYFDGCYLFFHARYPWLESIPPYDEYKNENRNQDNVGRAYEEEDEIKEYKEGHEVEGAEAEFEFSDYSRHIARFLDGPMLSSKIQLDRHERCYCGLGYDFQGHCNCVEPRFPSQLLDVCQAIAKEVEHIFFSKNNFNVCRSDLGGLSGLFSIRPRALSYITSLCIRLNRCDCELFHDSEICKSRNSAYHHGACHSSCVRGHESLLRCPVLHDDLKAMEEWKLLCRYLACTITPHQLRLSVICDVADVEAGKQIIEPLMQLPILEACTIRLGVEACQDGLQDLARDAVLRLTGRSFHAHVSPFRFTDLPREIQLHVLRYTDLVTSNYLTWSPARIDTGPRIFEASAIERQRGALVARYDCRCCGKCTDIMESCCCHTKCSAASTSCTCWKMPISLFSVSRIMREDAIAIFYSRNHFLILPPRFETVDDEPLEILRFLSRFAVRGRMHLQSITWMLPERIYPISGTRMHREWESVVDICAQEMALNRLRFTIDLSYHAVTREAFGKLYSSPKPISELEEDEWNAGLLMVESMARYKGWKNVFVHLSWPWHNIYNPNDPYQHSEEAHELRKHREKVLEEQVMGQGYDANNKYDRRHARDGSIFDCKDFRG